MNKTNHIILILALCFSLTFVVYPLRTFAGDCGGCGQPACPPPTPVEEIDSVCSPPKPDPQWANSCSKCGDYASTKNTCYKWTYPTAGDMCPDECRNNADCRGSGNGGSGNGGGTTTTTGAAVTTTTSPPEPSPCVIDYFELPLRAWVGYPITGRWSASDWCDDCDVDCTSYPECVWKLNNIGIGDIGADEYKFTLSQSGIYDYTLTCYGQGGIDERTETATVEALNLPWWREIIPVLPGFLRGIFR